MERKIIITLKEAINNGKGATSSVYCDSIVVDGFTGSCIGYYVDNVFLFVPIENVLGTFLNPSFERSAKCQTF